MRIVIQRVNHASVKVDGETIGSIGKGYLLLLGVAEGDTKEIGYEDLVEWLISYRDS